MTCAGMRWPTTAASAMFRTMKTLVASAAALLALACATLPAPGRTQDLRVLVYNIHAGTDAARVDNLARVADIVRESGADIVLLQEVDSLTARSGGVDQLTTLTRLTGLRGAYGRTIEYQGGGYGLAVLSRFPIASHRLVPLPSEPAESQPGRARELRGALVARIETPGGPVHVVNTHIDAAARDHWRRQEATRLVLLTDSLRAAGARILVGGDLNSTPESFVQSILGDGALRDAWAACGNGPGFTFAASAPVKRIDYLYLTGGSTCSDAQVLATDASDHLPLLVQVQLR